MSFYLTPTPPPFFSFYSFLTPPHSTFAVPGFVVRHKSSSFYFPFVWAGRSPLTRRRRMFPFTHSDYFHSLLICFCFFLPPLALCPPSPFLSFVKALFFLPFFYSPHGAKAQHHVPKAKQKKNTTRTSEKESVKRRGGKEEEKKTPRHSKLVQERKGFHPSSHPPVSCRCKCSFPHPKHCSGFTHTHFTPSMVASKTTTNTYHHHFKITKKRVGVPPTTK